MTSEEFHKALYRERCRREAVENENRQLRAALKNFEVAVEVGRQTLCKGETGQGTDTNDGIVRTQFVAEVSRRWPTCKTFADCASQMPFDFWQAAWDAATTLERSRVVGSIQTSAEVGEGG